MSANLNTMEWKSSPYMYKLYTNNPYTASTPAFTQTTGLLFIMVETYPYGMVPYSCYTASSYPTSTITISLNGGANFVTNTATT
tara:strand:- start:373 stop:624 length:252 start_codon:yes stop_codon:yes gene_type:complete